MFPQIESPHHFKFELELVALLEGVDEGFHAVWR
jgi:hypothetical protein